MFCLVVEIIVAIVVICILVLIVAVDVVAIMLLVVVDAVVAVILAHHDLGGSSILVLARRS